MCTNVAMCFGMFACHACSDCIGASFKQQVRLGYFFFDAIFVALGLLLLYGLSSLLSEPDFMVNLLTNFVSCPDGTPLKVCFGISSVYRLSLALVILHLFILFFVLMRNGCSKVFNEEVWLFKILVVICLFIGFFFINNDFFQGYSTVAMVLSLFFLLFQVVMIIDLCYMWGVTWIKYYDEGNNIWMYLIILATIIVYGGTIFFVVSSFHSFAGIGPGTFVSIVSLLFVIAGAVLVFFKLNPDGSLLTSGAVSLISSYLTWSGLTNMNDPNNPWRQDDSGTIVNLLAGLVIIIASLLYVSVGSAGNAPAGSTNVAQAVLEQPKGEEDEKRKRLDEEEELGANKQAEKAQLSQDVYQSNSFIYFHLIMIFANCYIAMLLTNWGSPVIEGQTFFDFQASTLSMWIKIGSSWFTMAVYLWTIIAPTVCPSRDFS